MKNKIGIRTKVIINILLSGTLAGILELLAAGLFVGRLYKLAETQSELTGTRITVYLSIVVLLFALFGIAVTMLTFWLLQRRSVNYTQKLADNVKRISGGDISTSIEIEDDNELSEIALSLNDMMKRLRELIRKEHEAERSKNELITNIAHDLRTPLTSIIGYLELLTNRPDLSSDMRRDYIQIAYTKSRKLQQLIEELFGLTKLTNGKKIMKLSKVDLIKLLSQLIDEFYPNFEKAGLAYELTSNVDSYILNADGNLLVRVFDNLINNAIKYGSDGKRIDVKVDAGPDSVTVYVINYGRVIPAEALPNLFERFYRVEQSRSVETGGTGLGLAIAKDIVQMHGGTISAESDMNGTRFIVTLKPDYDPEKEDFGGV